jgi:iron complex transport system substrate-binding protein
MHHRHLSSAARPARLAIALVLAALLIAGLALAGCTAAQSETSAVKTDAAAADFPVTLTDDAGREVTIESRPERIVSLAPANTEIVYALGLLDKLVGVTTYDDYPPEVADIEKMGDFVAPNLEVITAAQPDLILATTGVQADVIEQLEGTGAVVLAIDPQTLSALFVSIGTQEESDRIVSEMETLLDDIAEIVSAEEPTECFVEIAQDPLYTAGSGTLIDDLIKAAGGVNVVTAPGYVGYSLEQLVTDDPTVYMATKGSMSDPSDLGKRPGYDKLSAVVSGRVAVLTDNYVSRPGPRIGLGVLEMARALHPDLASELPEE